VQTCALPIYVLILQSNGSWTESQPAVFHTTRLPGSLTRLLKKGKGSILKAFPQGKVKIGKIRGLLRLYRRKVSSSKSRLTSFHCAKARRRGGMAKRPSHTVRRVQTSAASLLSKFP